MNGDIDRVLRNLGVVASLKQNDKLQTEGEFFAIYVPTAMRGFVRLLTRETREINITRTTECIRAAKTFVTSTMAEHSDGMEVCTTLTMKINWTSQVQICSRVLKTLGDVNGGLENLCQTYRDDAALVCRIGNLQDEVKDFVANTRMIGQTSPVLRPIQQSASYVPPSHHGRHSTVVDE